MTNAEAVRKLRAALDEARIALEEHQTRCEQFDEHFYYSEALGCAREALRLTDGAVEETPERDLLYEAWAVIANAGWRGEAKSPGWDEAAARWRNKWHELIGAPVFVHEKMEAAPITPSTGPVGQANQNSAGDILAPVGEAKIAEPKLNMWSAPGWDQVARDSAAQVAKPESGWRHVAAYYLGDDFTDAHTPEECRAEAVRRSDGRPTRLETASRRVVSLCNTLREKGVYEGEVYSAIVELSDALGSPFALAKERTFTLAEIETAFRQEEVQIADEYDVYTVAFWDAVRTALTKGQR